MRNEDCKNMQLPLDFLFLSDKSLGIFATLLPIVQLPLDFVLDLRSNFGKDVNVSSFTVSKIHFL